MLWHYLIGFTNILPVTTIMTYIAMCIYIYIYIYIYMEREREREEDRDRQQSSIQDYTFHLVIRSPCGGLVTQLCPTLWLHGLQPSRLPFPWDFPVKNTGMGGHFFLQGIFPTQGSNPDLHCRWSPALQMGPLPGVPPEAHSLL